jgi:ElaB/YqjD/DUF883 family membrane-anchored ribosome-binding protein
MQTATKYQSDADIGDAGKGLRDNARRAKEDLRDAIGIVKEDAEDIAHEAGRQVREFAHLAEKKVIEASKTVTETIHDNPVQSTVIALAAGVFLGMFFRR